MVQLSDEQLNNLNKEALIILVSALQSQLDSMQAQLDAANASLKENNHQIELLTEQIRLMNQRHYGRKAEGDLIGADGTVYEQFTLFDSFNEVEATSNPSIKEPEIEEVTISSYKRSKKKGKREEDLDGLPARIFEHKLSDKELSEKFPNGYKELPVEVYKRLHVIPETFIVDEHHKNWNKAHARRLISLNHSSEVETLQMVPLLQKLMK